MPVKPPQYKREIVNQLINFFWTILCFAPVLAFWINEGINLHFYLSVAAFFTIGMLPERILSLLTLSSSRSFMKILV